MKPSNICLMAIAGALFARGAFAAEPVATLDNIEGVVLVNQGEKYVTAASGFVLAPGDRVLVMAGAKAVVNFTDGCALPVSAGSTTTVPETSTCAGAVAQTEAVGPTYAQAAGGQPEAAAKSGGTSPALWVGAGLAAVAGAVALGSGGGGGSNSPPMSQ